MKMATGKLKINYMAQKYNLDQSTGRGGTHQNTRHKV